MIKNQSIRTFNTFGIDVHAENFQSITSEEALQRILKNDSQPLRVLGGGSNILLTRDLPGLTLKMDIPGIQIERSFKHSVYLSAGAGVNWHQLVLYCLDHDLGGIENLSLIPGTVGAAPIQNIGAYGIELKDVFHKLTAIHIQNRKRVTFRKKDCQFGYRNSFFKKEGKGEYIITKVWFKLSKQPHRIRVDYGAIQSTLSEKGIIDPTIRDISNAVIKIRSEKLPDPAKIGNSGSFFKNPVINQWAFSRLKKIYAGIPCYPQPDDQVKVPAGWLIEQAGWKGKRVGRTGVHHRQALVLVNHGGAHGEEIYHLAREIQASVKEKFDINLEMEVNVW